jgi:hypothetical protein
MTFAIVIVGAAHEEGEMPDARYFVERLRAHNYAWMIKFDDEEYGPYKSQSEAVLLRLRPPKSSMNMADGGVSGSRR